MVYEVHVLYDGYSGTCDEGMVANCSCTLIRGRKNIIVDTMTPWDKERVLAGLSRYHLTPDDISVVVCTHGHSDHIGNNNLFLNAKHIVGFSVSYRDMYNLHPFEEGVPYIVDEDIKIVPTPGHTNADVTVLVRTVNLGIVAIVGDLFEREEDLINPDLWRVTGGSENPKSQERYRYEMLLTADHIVPGHGSMFAVTSSMRKEAEMKLNSISGTGSRENPPERSRQQDERDWRNPPGETDSRSNPNHHRPSVWEGRLGPSNEWDSRQRDSSAKRSDRLAPRRDEPPSRGWTDRDKTDRDPWEDRRRSSNDNPFSPVPPLLDDDTLKRIEHKRVRTSSESGRHPRDLDLIDRNWQDRGGPQPPPPSERFRGERRTDGPWDDRLSHEPNDRIVRDDRPRFSRDDERLISHDNGLRRDDRTERERDLRFARNERLPRDRFGSPEIKPSKDAEIQTIRFGGGDGGGKARKSKRGSRGGRNHKSSGAGPSDGKEGGARGPRREEGFRREVREPRRNEDDRTARPKDDRLRRDVRPREDDFHERNRLKHDDRRNGSDGRTIRFHT